MTVRSSTAAAVLAPVMTLALLTGCSTPAEPEASPSPAASSASSTPSPSAPAVKTPGMKKDLAGFATSLYTGESVPASGPAAQALKKAQAPGKAATVKAATGTWNKEHFAVLTSGKDVTLVVKKKGSWTAVGGWWPSLGIPKEALGGKRHVLLMGSDAREKQGEKIEEARADALQLVGVDGHGGGGVMGIPRDLWVPQANGRNAKINSALSTGGPDAQTKVVSKATGLPVQGYVLTGFTGFQKMIDELGGITIKAPMKVRAVEKGTQKVDGYDAFWFTRERKTLPNGDFDRTSNQGIALAGIGAKAVAEGPSGLAKILDIADEHVSTDLTAAQALTFGAWAYRIELKKMGHQVPTADYGRSADGQSILEITGATRKVFADFKDGNLSK
ncbi:MAG: LCP family protein [Micrococcaceae bacterium]|nr:LCP family protein [Micrococcaceae bacterium]MDN5906310.1 LCP family protein [Micrococcaceae bacterium]